MSRAPRYNKFNTYRIISMPGGQWRLQRRRISGKGTPTIDPWSNAGQSMDLAKARIALAATNGE